MEAIVSRDRELRRAAGSSHLAWSTSPCECRGHPLIVPRYSKQVVIGWGPRTAGLQNRQKQHHCTAAAPDHPITKPYASRRILLPYLAMASRRLAFNLQQAMRSRAALSSVRSPLTRGLATPLSHGAKTETTTLTNGFTVCAIALHPACSC